MCSKIQFSSFKHKQMTNSQTATTCRIISLRIGKLHLNKFAILTFHLLRIVYDWHVSVVCENRQKRAIGSLW